MARGFCAGGRPSDSGDAMAWSVRNDRAVSAPALLRLCTSWAGSTGKAGRDSCTATARTKVNGRACSPNVPTPAENFIVSLYHDTTQKEQEVPRV